MLRMTLALIASAALALPVRAQWLGADYATYGAPLSSFMQSSVVNNSLMIQAADPSAQKRPDRAGSGAASTLRADAPADVQRNAADLARNFPPQHRATMTKTFADSMGIWYQLEAKLGVPRNDVGGALAAFVVGNYMVLTSKEVSDEEFGVVVDQLRRQPSLRTTLGAQSPAALRNLYEQSAMSGTFMALAYKSQQVKPQPPEQQANLRNAARENLRTIGLDPDRLRIGARGISMAD
ncbi:DUF6683 family protein [Duganella callida]|nr:DUF6683 family protein [Duganella callida]